MSTNVEDLLQALELRPRKTKTYKMLPNSLRARMRIKRLARRGWRMVGAPTKTGTWNRSHIYVFERPRTSRAERKILGW